MLARLLACGRYYRTVQEVQGATQTTSTVRCYGRTVGGLTAGQQSRTPPVYDTYCMYVCTSKSFTTHHPPPTRSLPKITVGKQ